ncbi:HAMP domain-containing sensor histidine kinase [Streptomyces sp. Ru87]|uniref:sensor histidine kinase n=1 Tax=Streptomyces sp. Ru87 TaxID=2044307 RepID=UPI000BF62EDB|nr:HAMP domain-containing sensor histidine kinase [Streptomyces sp. Ru87]PGH51213.1 two-component sensor histidine kinase [Streptomyces sp. Ru87]
MSRLLQGLVARLTPRRVRMRLTLLYGVLFVASGAVLLAITYFLVARRSGTVLFTARGGRVDAGAPDAAPFPGPGSGPEGRLGTVAEAFRRQAARQHQEEMQHLLVQSGIALAIMSVLAIGLGWLVAGRVLRPLRTMTGTIRRISARNVHERLAAHGPDDELKDLADTVDGLLGRLETALDSHKRFVANAAHELRTPLTLEHALLEETLIDREATVESFRANFERLLHTSKQQARLLESLLTLSGSERGLEHPEPLDLSAPAENVLGARRPEAGRRGVGIRARIAPVPVSGDPALIERLMANLVDNALHYNVPGGRVEFTTGIRDGRAVVSVENTGPEVPPDQVARLFEPFQRMGRAAGDGHHGLGLSIVRSIAVAHDAACTARARPSGGLAVEVSFPLRGDGGAGNGRHRPRAARGRGRALPTGTSP